MSFKLGLFVVAANLALFSCAPKDEKLVRPDTGGPKGLTTLSSVDAIKTLQISLDRQVEALHYLKLALNSEYAASKKMTITGTANPSEKVIVSEETKLSTGEYDQTANANVVAKIEFNEDQTVKSLTIKDNGNMRGEQKLFAKDNAANSILSVKNINKVITITKSEKAGVYDVDAGSYDEINSKNSGNLMSNSFTKFSIVWDGKAESLAQDIQITSALIGHNKIAVSKFIASTVAANLMVNLSSECASVNGTMSLTSTSKPKAGQNEVYELTVVNSSVTVAGKPAAGFEAAECTSRPLVDIRKLL